MMGWVSILVAVITAAGAAAEVGPFGRLGRKESGEGPILPANLRGQYRFA